VKRLLSVIKDEIFSSRLQDQVAVIVSDNASTDKTQLTVSEFLNCGLNLKYYRQAENLGFDGNLRFLYMQASTEYVWFMADDDLPLPGSIEKILSTLKMHDPDVLLFSFIQPPGSTVRQFDYPEPIRIVSDPVSVIEHTLRYTKVSIFVIRKVDFDSSNWSVLDANLGAGWYYISLAFSVLQVSQNLRLAVFSEPLATCDEDYFVIRYAPLPLLRMERIALHLFIKTHNPSLIKFYRDKGYCTSIQFAFAVKTGGVVAESPDEYDKFIKDLECRIPTLLKRPRSLLQFMALKLRIASLWPHIRTFLNLVKSHSL